jgi:hypothetical protein
MKITPLPKTGTAAKFTATLSKGRGEFMISLSYTLVHKVWELEGEAAALDAATRMAEAIVGRHNPKFPLKDKYIFGDHNTEPTLDQTVAYLKRTEI